MTACVYGRYSHLDSVLPRFHRLPGAVELEEEGVVMVRGSYLGLSKLSKNPRNMGVELGAFSHPIRQERCGQGWRQCSKFS